MMIIQYEENVKLNTSSHSLSTTSQFLEMHNSLFEYPLYLCAIQILPNLNNQFPLISTNPTQFLIIYISTFRFSICCKLHKRPIPRNQYTHNFGRELACDFLINWGKNFCGDICFGRVMTSEWVILAG